ncbi:MAG: hypothetical protein [Bacteriophage sp.]|nr:MAG: hypothetical protein [Bacteriophage sp.]
MPNVSSFGAQTDNSVVQGTVTDRAMVIPDIPPQGLMSVGPRVTPHFVKPSLWSALTTYHFFDAVHDAAGASYVAIKPEVPAGTELTDEDYWFLWADPNSQFADLSELVKTYNKRVTQNTNDINAEIARATEAEKTKAPINHASEKTIYGVGNAANYGHVRLATEGTPLTSGVDDGIAATPKMISDNFTFESEPRKILMIGNSYTTGFNEESAPYGIANQVKFAFDEVRYATESACGFISYEGHAYDFNTVLRGWYSRNPQAAQTITDIAINSAVGDSFCYVADSSYGDKANYTMNSILNFCQNNFPKLKRVRVFLCDSIYKTARESSVLKVKTSASTFARLNRYFACSPYFNNTKTNRYNFEVSYCGWIGAPLLGTEYMNNPDNIHPSLSGYVYMSRLWLSAYNGCYYATEKLFNITDIDASAFADGAKVRIKPFVSGSYVNLNVALSIKTTSTIKSINNWVTIGNISNIISSADPTYIVNVQPKVNFRININGDIQLRGAELDMSAVNLDGTFVNFVSI